MADPNTYLIPGSDGKLRKFVGDQPPSSDEIKAIEDSESPPQQPSIWDRVVQAAAHPTESVVPKQTQLKAISPIVGSPQQPASSSIENEVSQFGDTLRAFRDQPIAATRGLLGGAAEGAMDMLTPLNAALSAVPYLRSGMGAVGEDLAGAGSWRQAVGRLMQRAAGTRAAEAAPAEGTDAKSVIDRIIQHNKDLAEREAAAKAARSSTAPKAPGGTGTPPPATEAPTPTPKPSSGPSGGNGAGPTAAADKVIDPLTGETQSQWRARMQQRLDQGGNGKPSTKATKINEGTEGANSLGTLQDAIHGGEAPTVPNGGTAQGLQSELTRLRRTYGADRIAEAINPQAPEPVVGKLVQQSGGAPSAMPDIAQKALLEHLNNPANITNPGNFHRALSQLLREYKRNQGVANSDTARAVADTLKKFGYDVP